MIQMVDRDHEIVKYLRDQGWALAPQIAKRFFTSRHACSNRMRQLVQAGIIEALTMSDFRVKYWHERGVMNILCNVNGRTRVYRLHEKVRESLGKRWQKNASENMVAHQVCVGKIREVLEKTFQNATITYDAAETLKLVKRNNTEDVVVPDLVCHIDTLKLAIEVERKAWRGLGPLNSAYEDRFNALSLEYDLILYVVENEDHIKPLMKKADGRRKIGFSSILSPTEIFRLGYDPTQLDTFVEEHQRNAA
jgi:DNA-binding Lrp family transcriptional regulator